MPAAPEFIKVTYKGVPTLKVKEIRGMKRQAMREAPLFWHSHYRGMHFTPQGARIYRYTPRHTKKIYTGVVRRQKKTGAKMAPDGRPLVWTGESFMRSRIKKIRAQTNRASVISPVRVFNIRPQHNRKINMREEYTTIVPREKRVLSKKVKKKMETLLVKHKRTVTVSVRGF